MVPYFKGRWKYEPVHVLPPCAFFLDLGGAGGVSVDFLALGSAKAPEAHHGCHSIFLLLFALLGTLPWRIPPSPHLPITPSPPLPFPLTLFYLATWLCVPTYLFYCASVLGFASPFAFLPWYPLAVGDHAEPVGELGRVAAARGATPAQVALAWLLARSPVVVPIPGTASVTHLEENVAAADLELTDEELAALG